MINFKTLERDRSFLEEKYHKLDGTFERNYIMSAHLNTKYGRMAFHGYDYDSSTGMNDEEIKVGLLARKSELDMLPHCVSKALAVKYVLENTRIDINEHDYFIGLYSWDRLPKIVTTIPWESEAFNRISPNFKAELKEMEDSGALLYWPDYDHVIVDWLAVMDLGFPGILNRARGYRARFEADGTLDDEKRAFFEAIEIEYSAIIAFIDRLYRYALTKTHEKAPLVAQCLKDLRDGAPKDTFEALQLMYIFFMIIESVDSYQVRSLGNGLDRTLEKFYKSDIYSGKYDRDQIGEFLGYFMMQYSAIGNYWGHPFYISGCDESGNTNVSDLTYLILDVYKQLGIYNPKIQVKINKSTPRELTHKIFDMIRNGQNSFVFCCDSGHIRSMMQYGVSYDEARDYEISGCVETRVRADEATTSGGTINGVKAVLYALYDGYDNTINKQYGLHTGKIEDIKTFADFYNAVVRQLEFLTEKMMAFSNKVDPYLSFINPSTMYSATITRSLEKGCDAYQSGVRFTTSNLQLIGYANMVDSVMAIKNLVFDRKIVTLQQFRDALDANWVGYEKLQAEAVRCPHKYGNGDAETDMYSEALSKIFAFRCANRRNGKNGLFKPLIQTARFIWLGKLTQASPDGRYAGTEISKNLTPAAGMDRNGVTALIESGLHMCPHYYAEGASIDIMLHPSVVIGEEGLTIMQSILDTYYDGEGMCIQFNIFDTEQLRDAQLHPSRYENLQVRVAGWNVLWNNLPRSEQDAYIKRAENIKF